MGFFKKLSRLFFAPAQPSEAAYWIVVKCNRCGETIRSRINLYNDLSLEYTDAGEAVYFCHKMLMGESGRCFQRIDIELTFDAGRNLLNREITGGQFSEGS